MNNLHIELRHPSVTITHAVAQAYGIQVTGTFKPCEDCALCKAKQCAASKKAVPCSKHWFFFYVSSPSTPTFGGKLLIIDDSHDFICSFFLKEKSNLADTMVGLIKNLKNKHNLQVQYFCCDNAEENIAFERACKQEGLGNDFEYAAPGMQQQNGCIEWKIATLFNQVHAMLNCGKFTAYLCNGLWAKAANQSPFQQVLGKGKRSILSSMQKFGEMCIATYRVNTHQAKLALVDGLAMQKAIPLVHTGYSTPRQKRLF